MFGMFVVKVVIRDIVCVMGFLLWDIDIFLKFILLKFGIMLKDVYEEL